jgi:hypothetical protein
MLCNKWVSLKKIIEKIDTEGYYFDTKINNIQIFFLNAFFENWFHVWCKKN